MKRWLPALIVLWLSTTFNATLGVLALEANVSSAAELRGALLNPGVELVRVMAEAQTRIVLDPASFGPLNLERAVTITSESGLAILDLGNAKQPLITVAEGGNLTLHALVISRFYPAAPLAYTTATGMMPLAAISITSHSAALNIDWCVLLVDGLVSKLTDTMPYWQTASQQGNLVDRSPTPQNLEAAATIAAAGTADSSLASSSAAAQQPRVIKLPPMQLRYYGGNSSVSMGHTLLAMDPSGCYNGSSLLAWDSSSLYAALHGTAAGGRVTSSEVLILADIALDAQQFCPLHGAAVGDITLTSCSSNPSSINLNRLSQAILVRQGATLRLTGGLQLLGAASLDETVRNVGSSANSSSSSDDSSSIGLLLLRSIDISAGAQLVLDNVTVAVTNSRQVKQAMVKIAQASSSSSRGSSSSTALTLSFGRAPLPAGSSSAAFVVESWSVGLSGHDLNGEHAAAAAGARLTMSNVRVVQAASSCFPSTQGLAVATDEAQLTRYLADDSISMIQIAADITLQPGPWQVLGGQLDILDIKRPLEIRGCHPDSSEGGVYTLDFAELKGGPMANVHDMLRISGDLTLRGIPDEADAGSWVLLPPANLVGQGYLEFQDVLLQGRTQSPLQDAKSDFWSSGLANGSVSGKSDHLADVHKLVLPVTSAARAFPGMFGSSAASSNSSYCYINTQLQWDPTLPAAAAAAPSSTMQPASIAAVVLGAVLGMLLLGLLLWGFVFLRQRQPGATAGRAGASSTGKKGWGCLPCLQPGSPGGGDPASTHGESEDAVALYAAANYAERGDGLFFRAQDHDGLLHSFITSGARTASVTLPYSELSRGQLPALANASMTVGSDPGSRHKGPWTTDMHGQLLQQQQQQQLQQGYGDGSGRQLSGNAELDSRANACRPQHGVSGQTEAHTTQTEDGTQHGPGEGGGAGRGHHKQQVFEDARKKLGAKAGEMARSDALVLESVLGEGTFGKVFKGYWKGTLVAVKTMMFPAAMSGKEKREKMAIMETAISASLSHPNIVQMYTYYLRPVLVGHEAQLSSQAGAREGHRLDASSVGDSSLNAAFLNEGLAESVHSWEVQLVLEYCDQGSLRQLLNNNGAFALPDGGRDMLLILDTALDVARAMVHLHSENIIHSDLKARNILLKSSGGADGRPFVAKVADFGLSMRIDPAATHVSNVYQGTMTHMAPEVMLQGKLSRGSDVYAFGVLLWELYSGGHAFKGIPRALLGHEVAHKQRRPEFPEGSPFDYQLLACRCWESDASIRPSFQEILAELQRMRERMAAAMAAGSAQTSAEAIVNASAGLRSTKGSQQLLSTLVQAQSPPSPGLARAAVQQEQQQQQQSPTALAAVAALQHPLVKAGSQGNMFANEVGAAAVQQQQQQGQGQQDAASAPSSTLRKAKAKSAADLLSAAGRQPGSPAAAQRHHSGTLVTHFEHRGDVAGTAKDLYGPSPLQALAAATAAAVAAGTGAGMVGRSGVEQQQQQQQQDQGQQQSALLLQARRDSIPEHLLQQLSITVSCEDAPLNKADGGGAAGAAAGDAAGPAAVAASGGLGSPLNSYTEEGGSGLGSPLHSYKGGGSKSTYAKDPFSSTEDGFGVVVHGAGAAPHMHWQATPRFKDDAEPAGGSAAAAAARGQGPSSQPSERPEAQEQKRETGSKQHKHSTRQRKRDEQQQQQPQSVASSSGAAGGVGRLLPFVAARRLIRASSAEASQSAPTASSSTSGTPLPTIGDTVVARLSDVLPASQAAAAVAAVAPTAARPAAGTSRSTGAAANQPQEQQQQQQGEQQHHHHLPVVQQLQQQLHQGQHMQHMQQPQPLLQQDRRQLLQEIQPAEDQRQREDVQPATPRQQHAVQPQPPVHHHHQQQQHQQHSRQARQSIAIDKSSSVDLSDSSGPALSLSSSGDFAPTSDSMNSSSSRPHARSGSVAALQAVLSLKASLAKRALSGAAPERHVPPTTIQALEPGYQVNISGPLPCPATAAGTPDSRGQSQPLPAIPGVSFSARQLPAPLSAFATANAAAAAAGGGMAAGRAVSGDLGGARFLLDAQQAAAAAAGAWPAGVEPTGRFSLDTRLGSGPTGLSGLAELGLQQSGALRVDAYSMPAAAAAPPGGIRPGGSRFARASLDSRTASAAAFANAGQQHWPAVAFIPQGASSAAAVDAAAAGGRMLVDTRSAAAEAGAQYHRGVRATASARGGFAGLAGHCERVSGPLSGSMYAHTAGFGQPGGSPSARSPPVSPTARFRGPQQHVAVRKANSTSQLSYGAAASGAAGAGAAWPSASGAASRASAGASGQQQQQQQQQQQLVMLPGLLQRAGSGGSGQNDAALDELAGLHPDQLQLLAEIADAAKAQVSLPLQGLAKPTQAGTSLSGTSSGVLSHSSSAPSGPLVGLSSGIEKGLSGLQHSMHQLSLQQQQQQQQGPKQQTLQQQQAPKQQSGANEQAWPSSFTQQQQAPQRHLSQQQQQQLVQLQQALLYQQQQQQQLEPVLSSGHPSSHSLAATDEASASTSVLRSLGQHVGLPPLWNPLQQQSSLDARANRSSAPPQHRQSRDRRLSVVQQAGPAAGTQHQQRRSRRNSAPVQQRVAPGS